MTNILIEDIFFHRRYYIDAIKGIQRQPTMKIKYIEIDI